MRHNTFNEAYKSLAGSVWYSHRFESSPRGQRVYENLAASFSILNPRARLLTLPERDASLCYVIAESLWYMLGEDKTEWIANYSHFWNKISDDGMTANSAYGARIFKQHPKIADGRFVQWESVAEELTRDRDSRRAVIHIRTPGDTIDAKLDVPCTLALQFFIRDNALDLIVNMRSSDLILGITNDIPAFCLFQELMARKLGVEMGTYHHTSNSLHVYERHFDMCKKIADSDAKPSPILPLMPKGDIPLKQLDRIQELARSILTVHGLDHFEKVGAKFLIGDSDPYWQDWAKILIAHRAGKLGEPTYMAELIASTTCDAYHAFKK